MTDKQITDYERLITVEIILYLMKCVFYNNVNLLEQWIKLFVIYVILIDFILIFNYDFQRQVK